MVVPSHRGRSRKLRKEGGVLGGEKIIWRECNLGPYWVITQYHLKDGYLPKILKHLRNGRGGGWPLAPSKSAHGSCNHLLPRRQWDLEKLIGK